MRAVAEQLRFQRSGTGQQRRFPERDLARQDDPGEAIGGEGVHIGAGHEGHLGACVEGDGGIAAVDLPCDAAVRDDEGGHAARAEPIDEREDRVHLARLHARIDGDVGSDPPHAALSEGLIQLPIVEIPGAHPVGERVCAEIDRVGTGGSGGKEGIRRTGGGEQLRDHCASPGFPSASEARRRDSM